MVKLTFSIAAMAAVAASVGAAPMTVFSSPAGFADCIPGTTVKEYHPFYLESVKLRSLLSKKPDDNLVVGGVPGNKGFEQLELCIVSTDYGCDRHIPSNCIYPNVEYRFRVNGPVKGYLSINGEKVEIVDEFKDASGLNLYREEGWGLRIAHRQKQEGEEEEKLVVFATNGSGKDITVEEPSKNEARQWFEIVEDSEQLTEQVGCLSSLRVYQSFKLHSLSLDTFIAKYPLTSMVIASDKLPLVMCAAFGDFPCSSSPPKICVREYADYYIRVEVEDADPANAGPGYLKAVGRYVRIVREIKEASKFFLFNDEEEGQVRVGHRKEGGELVFTAEEYGYPIGLQEPSKGIMQGFRIDRVKSQ